MSGSLLSVYYESEHATGPAARKLTTKFCSKRTPWNKGVPKPSVSDQENPNLLWNASGYCRRYTTVFHQPSESAEPNQRRQSILMLSFNEPFVGISHFFHVPSIAYSPISPL